MPEWLRPGNNAVITGGASGIGRELARRFKAEGAAGIVVADVQEEALVAVAEEVGGLAVVTDVTKDGTMRGPNIELLKSVLERTDHFVIASGGISNLDDIAALRELVPLGLEGAILGKALYAGAFTLTEALDVAGR